MDPVTGRPKVGFGSIANAALARCWYEREQKRKEREHAATHRSIGSRWEREGVEEGC